MPTLKNAVPKYRKHRASGQAVVTIAGRDHYLGPWRTKASKAEYDRLIGEWLAAGRPVRQVVEANQITVVELVAEFWKYARNHYRRADGTPTGTAENFKPGLTLLRQSYGHTDAEDFGPIALKAIRQRMIDAGQSRRYINDSIDRIRKVFRWAASEEKISIEVYQRLATVERLAKGRTQARESTGVRPVEDSVVVATIEHLPKVVADMVQFQRLTGCRPQDVYNLRPREVEATGDVWLYRPGTYKTEHHGRERVVYVGPKAQDILRPYLLRADDAYCFSPADSERKRRKEQHEVRKTPLSHGNRPGTNRKRKPKRSAGHKYTKDSYNRAVQRACDKAAVERWSPNRLRHSAGTEIRKRYGLEAAQVILGHASADVTQVYAERDLQKAVEIMREVG